MQVDWVVGVANVYLSLVSMVHSVVHNVKFVCFVKSGKQFNTLISKHWTGFTVGSKFEPRPGQISMLLHSAENIILGNLPGDNFLQVERVIFVDITSYDGLTDFVIFSIGNIGVGWTIPKGAVLFGKFRPMALKNRTHPSLVVEVTRKAIQNSIFLKKGREVRSLVNSEKRKLCKYDSHEKRCWASAVFWHTYLAESRERLHLWLL